MINSTYFAFASNEFLDKRDPIKRILLKILDKFSNTNYLKNLNLQKEKNLRRQFLFDLVSFSDKNAIKKNEDEKFIVESPLDKKNISLEFLIEFLEENLRKISEENEKNLSLSLLNNLNYNNFFGGKLLKDKDGFIEIDEIKNKFDKEDVLMDLRYKSKYSKDFMDYIINKNEEMNEKKKDIILTRLDEEKYNNPDDIVCLVCNDGDYEDNDLIVYCSKCQMTVHQNCYGIINIPEEDWLCYPCQAFEDERSKEIECILCPIKGGAMKPSLLKCKSSICNYLINMRKENPNYKTSNLIGLISNNNNNNNNNNDNQKSSLNERNSNNAKNDLGKLMISISILN
jgi:hypothetical protein